MMERSGNRGGDHDGHVDLERLLAYAHGEIGGDAAAQVLRHSLSCRECGDELAVMLALTGHRPAIVGVEGGGGTAAIAPAAGPRIGADVRSRRWTGLAAAAIVIALISGSIWWSQRSGVFPADPSGSADAPDVADTPGPTDLAATGDVPAPAEVSGAAALARLATTEPPDPTMTQFLFSGQVADRADARTGFVDIVDGRHDRAVAYLMPLWEVRPDDGEIAATLGIALYLSGDDSERTAALLQQGRALPRDDFGHLSGWYLANLYLRRGQMGQAMEVLEELALYPDSPGTRAAGLLERLRSEAR